MTLPFRMARRAPEAAVALSIASALAIAVPAAAAPAKPNIIVIVADDLGYGDLSAYGSPHATPNIDKLAKDGVKFTQGYVTAALCSPSRAGLLTGRYQQRFGHEYQLYSPVNNAQSGIDAGQPTLARSLRAAGYRTALYGKWHLGVAPERHPLRMGFDEFFGILGGQTPYIAAERPDVASSPAPDKAPQDYVRGPSSAFQEAGKPLDLTEYATTAFTDHALSFIDRNRASPFFLLMTYTAPHTPLQATRSQMEKAPKAEDPELHLYRTVINELDIGVGQIRDRLARNGLTDNTMIVFISDNGCPDYVKAVCSNAPLNSWKRYLTEGGVRVPYMISWPAKIGAGRTFDGVVSSLDIFPTALAAAGAEGDPAQPTDGRDLLPYLRGTSKGAPHDKLFWRSLPSYAIRSGDWKLLVNASPKGETVTMLFDLANDREEKADLASRRPDVVARLNREWKAWSDTLASPRWPTAREFDVEVNGVPIRTTN